jgi:hypothetical protein
MHVELGIQKDKSQPTKGIPLKKGSSLMADWLLLEPKPLMFPPRRTILVSHGLCQLFATAFKRLIIKSLKYFAFSKLRTISRLILQFLHDFAAHFAKWRAVQDF